MTLKTSELTITLHRVIDGYSEPSSSSCHVDDSAAAAARALRAIPSQARAAASRENGRKGGRPRRSCESCGSRPAYRAGLCAACSHAVTVHGALRANAYAVECDRKNCKP
jgi:hypothetical protein